MNNQLDTIGNGPQGGNICYSETIMWAALSVNGSDEKVLLNFWLL